MDFIAEIEKQTHRVLKKEFVEAQKGDVTETYADTSKLYRLSGYRAKTNLTEGIKSFIKWYTEYYKEV